MRTFRRLCVAMVLVTLTCLNPAWATSYSTDHSDLWWIPSEAGWGIQFVQQHDIIFATMFAYDHDSQPIWFVATMPATGSGGYSGTLYVTQGPYFGFNPFNPVLALARQVGVMSATFQFVESGTLTYSVDGTYVTKQIVRQNLTNQNFNGIFAGGINSNYVSGDCHLYALAKGKAFASTITHNRGAAIAMTFTTSDDLCSMPAGTYTQSGHFGKIQGNFTCQSGDVGSLNVFEGNVAVDTIMARYTFQSTSTGCNFEGDFAGVRQ